MSEQKVGFTFTETMAGGFSLGSTEPGEGHAQGRREASSLAIHVSIQIDDLARFVDNPNHLGALVGTIDFTPFGEGIPASSGTFNLFSPGDQPRLKLMRYELAFEHDGEPYYFAGAKDVRDDPGLDLWKDTTTLFSRLHRGSNAEGEVVGAGVLSLGVADLIKMMATMRVLGAENAAQSAKALAQFGSLFLGKLWDTYVRYVPKGH